MGQDQSVPKGLGPPRTGPPAPALAKSAVSLRAVDPKPTTAAPPVEKRTTPAKTPMPEATESEKVEKPTKPSKDGSAPSKASKEAKPREETLPKETKSPKPASHPKSSTAKPAAASKETPNSRSLLPVSAKSSSAASKKVPTKVESVKKSKPASRTVQTTLTAKMPKHDDSDEEVSSRIEKSAAEVDEEAVSPAATINWIELTAVKAEAEQIFVLAPAVRAPSSAPKKSMKEQLNPIIPNFTLGAYYRRKDIIGRYKGQSMSGIVTPANARYLFIFSTAHETAESNPYVDGWRGEQFWYTGEGLKGDQRMLKGNYQIRFHKQIRKHIFLFQKANTKETLHRYVGEFKCISTRVVDGMDSENRPRKEFKFILVRQSAYEPLSDKEELEEDPLPPSRFNKNETLPGYSTRGKRYWRAYEHEIPRNVEIFPETEVLRPDLGSMIQFSRAPISLTRRERRVFRATQVSTAPASRDFTPSGKGSYMGKLLNRPSVYDGTDGPEEMDLVGVEYEEEPVQNPKKQVAKITPEEMKKKRQRQKQILLIKTLNKSQEDELEDAPPAKRVKRDEADE